MRPVVLVTAKEMQAIDRRAISELGIPSLVLMENAGVAVVRELEREFGDLEGKRCLILAGRGNNGGDGLVIARHLLNRDAKVKVFLVAEERDLSQDCRVNLEIFKKLQGEIHVISPPVLSKLKINLALNDLVIDAMVGTGFSGQLRASCRKWWKWLTSAARQLFLSISPQVSTPQPAQCRGRLCARRSQWPLGS